MGFLDRLEKISRGVYDMAMAPLGVPYDLIRVIPDENMTIGRAFGSNLEQFTQGVAGVAQGTGISGVASDIAEHTPIDEILGGIMFQAELIFNQEAQLQANQVPLGLGGDIGGWNNPLDPGDVSVARVAGAGLGLAGIFLSTSPMGNPYQDDPSQTWKNITQLYSRTDPRIMGLSPGQAFVLNSTEAINLSEDEMREYMGSNSFKTVSGTIDVLVRWFGQPEVIAGKGIKVARRKWTPRIIDRVKQAQKQDIRIKPLDSRSSASKQLDEAAESAESYLKGVESEGEALTKQWVEDIDNDIVSDPSIAASYREKLVLANQRVDDTRIAQLQGGGALNMQVDLPEGQYVYYVATSSQLDNMVDSGILRVPPGAEDAFVQGSRMRAFAERIRQELPELMDDDTFRLQVDRLSPDDIIELEMAFEEVLERLRGQLPDPSLELFDQIPGVIESVGEQTRLIDLIMPDNVGTFIDGNDLEDLINLASNPIERRSLALAIYAKNVQTSKALSANVSIGLTDPTRIPAPHRRVIHLLGEDELPEAYRYAAALYQQNPADLPVIIKLNPKGLPVVYEDFLDPLMADRRSGLPKDASLITSVDSISSEHIVKIIRPAVSELDPGELGVIIREGQSTPRYFEPGGRMNERLFNPDGSPIRPEDMLPFDEVELQWKGMVEAYISGGPEESLKFANAMREKRIGQRSGSLSELITSEKRIQTAINQMDGMKSDEILRRWFDQLPGGPIIANLLADAGSYDLRRQILLSVAGILDPDVTMLPHITRARIKALRGTVLDMETSLESMRVKRALRTGMVDEADQATVSRYQELEEAVFKEIEELDEVLEISKFLNDVRENSIMSTMPRSSRIMDLKQNIRTSHWYQSSIGSRPIRSVVEKNPKNWLGVHDPRGEIQIVRQLEAAAPLGITDDVVSKYTQRFMLATNEVDKIRIVTQMDEEIITAAVKKSGLDKADLEQIISASRQGKATAQEVLKSRRYAPDGHDIVTFYDPLEGSVVKLSMPLLSTQLQNWIPLTNVKELIRVSTKVRRIKARYGKVPGDLMDTFINVWKPSVLLRGGWPLRVVSDEQLRILALTGSLIRHLGGIEVGGKTPWGFANVFGPGRTGAQRTASLFSLPTSIIVAGSTRAAIGLSRAARKLKIMNPEHFKLMEEAGTELMASSRTAYGGPNQTILQESASMFGTSEAGIMDSLVSRGTGEWSTVSKGTPEYFPVWKRALQDQLGRDDLARIFLEHGGVDEIKVLTQNPSLTAIRRGIEEVFEDNYQAGFFDNFDPSNTQLMDDIAEEIFDVYEAMSGDVSGRRVSVDLGELEGEVDRIIKSHIEIIDSDGFLLADDLVLTDDIVDGVENWMDNVIDETAKFAHLRQDGKLTPQYIDSRLDDWFDDVIGDQWRDVTEFVDIRNRIRRKWLNSTHRDMDDVAEELRRAFSDAASKDLEFARLADIDLDNIRSLSDDFKGMYGESWTQAKSVEITTRETAKIRAKEWLNNTPEGREYKTRMPWRSNIDKWLDDVSETVGTYTSDFNPTLTQAALDLKVTRSVLESVDEALRPATIHGEIIDQVLGRSVVTKWLREFTATSFETFGRLPTDTLSRQPFFRHMYANEMMRKEKLFRMQGGEMTEEILKKMDVSSRNFALREVKKWLYDLSESSRFGHMMRWYIPFYPAWQEVLEVWGGIIMKDPSVIGRGLLIWRTPNKLGIVEQDSEGNEYITLRLSDRVVAGMGLEGWTEYIATGGIRFGKGSFNMITNNPFPSVGPLIQIPINDVVKRRPDLEEALKFILPYGVRSNSLSVVTSPIIKRLSSFITGPEGDSSYQRDFTNVLIWLDWKFRSGESSVPPSYEEAHNIARKIWTIRLFANATAPAQPIFDTPLKPYIDIYRDLIETIGPEDADEAFLGQYGQEFFAVTMSRTVSVTGIPPTVEGQAARQRFESLITKYPEYGRFIIGEDSAIGEFSSAAFAWQLTNPPTDDPSFFGDPERVYRDLELDPETGMITEVDRRLGWQEYIRVMDLLDLERRKRGLPNLRVKEAKDLAALKKSLTENIGKKYPEWWRDFNERDDLKWTERIKAMRDISTAVLRIEDRPDMEGVQSYLRARSLILQELNHRKQLGGSSTLEAKSNQDLQQLWGSMVNKVLDDNIHFLPIYYRYLEGDTVEVNSG